MVASLRVGNSSEISLNDADSLQIINFPFTANEVDSPFFPVNIHSKFSSQFYVRNFWINVARCLECKKMKINSHFRRFSSKGKMEEKK